MTAIVHTTHFSGKGRLHGSGEDSLVEIIRGLAIDNAVSRVASADFGDFTDSSGGTVSTSISSMAIATEVYDATSSGGSPTAGFNTAAGKLENAGAVFADWLNRVRARIGLPLMTWDVGTIATPGTIAALDLTLTATSGASAVDYGSCRAAMIEARDDITTLLYGTNEVLAALGRTQLTGTTGGSLSSTRNLDGISTVVSDADGSDSVADSVVDAFLTAAANNIATMASAINRALGQTGLSDLTNNLTGATADDTIAAIPQTFDAHQDGSTDSAPKAGLDTTIQLIEDNLSDLTDRINLILGFNDLSLLTNSTGVSSNTTLAAVTVALTAVDGSGSNAAEHDSVEARFATIANNVASLAAKVNLLAPKYGLTTLTDSSGGTASSTIAEVAATAAGVDNGAAATGVADADVDAALVLVNAALTDIAAKVQAMTGGTTDEVRPLNVVRGIG